MKLALLLIVSLVTCHVTVARRRRDGSRRLGRMNRSIKKGLYKVCGAIKLLNELQFDTLQLPQTTTWSTEAVGYESAWTSSRGSSSATYGSGGTTYGSTGTTAGSVGRTDYGSYSTTYGSYGQSYGSSEPTYGSYGPNYGSSEPTYGSYGPNYGSSEPTYGSYGPNYGSSEPTYGSYGPNYGSSESTYGSYGPNYGSSEPTYGPNYGFSGPIYESYEPNYGSSGSTYQTYGSSGSTYESQGPTHESQAPTHESHGPTQESYGKTYGSAGTTTYGPYGTSESTGTTSYGSYGSTGTTSYGLASTTYDSLGTTYEPGERTSYGPNDATQYGQTETTYRSSDMTYGTGEVTSYNPDETVPYEYTETTSEPAGESTYTANDTSITAPSFPGLVPVLGQGQFSTRALERGKRELGRVSKDVAVRLLDSGLMDILRRTCDSEILQDVPLLTKGQRFASLSDEKKIIKLKRFVVRKTLKLCMVSKRLQSVSFNNVYLDMVVGVCTFFDKQTVPSPISLPEFTSPITVTPTGFPTQQTVNARAMQPKSDMVLMLANICRDVYIIKEKTAKARPGKGVTEDSDMVSDIKQALTSICDVFGDAIKKH